MGYEYNYDKVWRKKAAYYYLDTDFIFPLLSSLGYVFNINYLYFKKA